MTPVPKRFAALAIAALAAGTLAACGGSSGNSSSSSSSSGKPVSGGTLNYVAAGDVDHLDPLSAYYLPTFMLELACTRQLVSYWPSNDNDQAITIAPDVASTVPTTSNGGITNGGKTYTFHLRSGVMWNTSPPSPVTSADFLREFKWMCNPSLGVGNPLYYVPVIKGMSSYCAAFAKVKPTASAMTSFTNSHSISGIKTPNSTTIQFNADRSRPTTSSTSWPCRSPRRGRPSTTSTCPTARQFRQHTLSDGPYAITQYIANKKIVLSRNPAWKQSTDPLRHQYVSQIVVTEGTSSTQTALANVQAGTDDLMWDLPVPTPSIPQLQASKNPGLHIYTDTGSSNPYLVFNLKSPTANHALAKLKVRQAIEYAINKVALAKIYGGTKLNPVLNQRHRAGQHRLRELQLLPDPGQLGRPGQVQVDARGGRIPARAHAHRRLPQRRQPPGDLHLRAGQPQGVRHHEQGQPAGAGPVLRVHREPGQRRQVGHHRAGLGARLAGQQRPGERGAAVPDQLRQPDQPTTAATAARSTDKDIKQALTAPSESAAAPLWAKAGEQVMKDAAIVPFMTQDVVLFASPKVHNLIYSPVAEHATRLSSGSRTNAGQPPSGRTGPGLVLPDGLC